MKTDRRSLGDTLRAKPTRSVPAAAAVLGLGMLVHPGQAATTSISSRSAVGGTDFVDWGTLGVEFTPVANPGVVFSNDGLRLDISKPVPQGGFEVAQEGGLSWDGNFVVGDALLSMGGDPGGVLLDFSSPVGAAGAQVQLESHEFFFITLTAFDPLGAFLGNVLTTGLSTGDGDGSAVFVGIASDLSNIDMIEFRLFDSAGNPGSFALNRVEIGPPNSVVVPEGTTWWAGGALGLVLMGWVWRSRRHE